MRKKLEKFLEDNEFIVKFSNCITLEHYGGKSFYNDGSYQEEIHKISKGKEYWFIHDKYTGRPRFTLRDKNYHIVFLDFSQNGFIEQFKRKFNL